MTIEVLGRTVDQRTGSNILYCKCKISEYLNIVGEEYKDFFIQRKRENHKAYSRMKSDVKGGTLLPAITLAIDESIVDKVLARVNDEDGIDDILYTRNSVNILDGLQRTFILDDLKKEGHDFHESQEVFLECWLEKNLDHLIYRMIVLNSGQKSMSMRHQIELLFVSLKNKISEQIDGIEIFLERESGRRTSSNKYALGNIASAYNAFISKHTELDKSKIVSEQLDEGGGLDSKEDEILKDYNTFIHYFRRFVELDKLAWDNYQQLTKLAEKERKEQKDDDIEQEESEKRYKVYSNGHKWFASENTMIAFFCSVSTYLGTKKEPRVSEALDKLKKDLESGVDDHFGLTSYEAKKDKLNPRKVNIGYGTRNLLNKGFKEYFTEAGDMPFNEAWELADV